MKNSSSLIDRIANSESIANETVWTYNRLVQLFASTNGLNQWFPLNDAM